MSGPNPVRLTVIDYEAIPDITPEQGAAATRRIAERARDADDARLLLGVVLGWPGAAAEGAPEPPALKPAADRPVYGPGQVAADPSRRYAQGLIDKGMTLTAVAEAARMSKAALRALLQGQYAPGRPPQRTIYAATEARILAVQYVPPAPVTPTHCKSGRPYTLAGHHVGRCGDCGQLAPMYHNKLNAHPRPGFEEET